MISGIAESPLEGLQRIFRYYNCHVLAVLVLLATVVIPADAGNTGGQASLVPKLEPSEEVAEILSALKAGESVWLPPAGVLGDFNDEAKRHRLHETGPRGRDFCIKAVWAPERQRALFAGANHGSPHRLNDVWEYDLAANAWYLLYAPDPSVLRGNEEAYQVGRDSRQHSISGEKGRAQEGVTLVHTQRGGPAHLSHTYWGFTYDPARKVMVWNLINANRDGSYVGPPIWQFDPQQRTWTPLLAPKPRPRITGVMASEYIRDLGGTIWYGATWKQPGMWLQPSDSSRFVDLQPNDGVNPYRCAECPGSNAVMAYNDEDKVLIAVSETRTYHYDVETNRWSMVVDGAEDEVPHGHYARSVFGYEPASGVALLYSRDSPDVVWAYDSAGQRWSRHRVNGPAGPTQKIIGYVDPARNVLVVNDSREVWVYRHGSDHANEVESGYLEERL